ncbi:MAG: radical SAM protein [Polyangia bacterium]|nr:radical SAM protein [Polyangia bacterium]
MTRLLTSIRERVQREARWKRHEESLAELVRTHPLRYLFLEITRRCNLACSYCGSECGPRGLPGELEAPDWIGVVRQIASDFDSKQVMVAVTGGEPLLKEGVLELFSELDALGFRFGMVTNGFFLDAEMAKRVVDTGIGSISLSMDAPPPVNDQIRARGATAKVEEAIVNLKDAGYKGKLEIISTLTRPAIALLEPMRRYLSELRVPLWRVAPVMPIGRAARRPDLLPSAEDMRTLLTFVAEARVDGLLPSPEFCEEGYLGDRFEGVVRPYLSQCRAGITTGGVLATGAIGACPELGEAFVQGDIGRERFREVWETRYQDLRDRSWTRKSACASCDAYGRCQGGSLHLYSKPGSELLRCLYQQLDEGPESK